MIMQSPIPLKAMDAGPDQSTAREHMLRSGWCMISTGWLLVVTGRLALVHKRYSSLIEAKVIALSLQIHGCQMVMKHALGTPWERKDTPVPPRSVLGFLLSTSYLNQSASRF
jgi:hypothetical protein